MHKTILIFPALLLAAACGQAPAPDATPVIEYPDTATVDHVDSYHGTDVADVLASVPPERERDIIYFDPSYRERVIGLNMLEYDPNYPEQKTFVVNELFSIFQKLYGSRHDFDEQLKRLVTVLIDKYTDRPKAFKKKDIVREADHNWFLVNNIM